MIKKALINLKIKRIQKYLKRRKMNEAIIKDITERIIKPALLNKRKIN